MIIDFQADPDTARRYDVLCARTGENINSWQIVHADDVEGIIRRYARDEDGRLIIEDGDGVLERIRKAIKIVSKSPAQLAEIDGVERYGDELRAKWEAEKARTKCHQDVPGPHAAKTASGPVYIVVPDGRCRLINAHSREIEDHPLPDDARIVNATYCPDLGMFTLLIASATYSPVPEGGPIPEVESPRSAKPRCSLAG
jgi:YD repeat-containing protein